MRKKDLQAGIFFFLIFRTDCIAMRQGGQNGLDGRYRETPCHVNCSGEDDEEKKKSGSSAKAWMDKESDSETDFCHNHDRKIGIFLKKKE